MHPIMTNFNLGRDVANKRERKKTAGHMAAGNRRYGSLITINPSAHNKCCFGGLRHKGIKKH